MIKVSFKFQLFAGFLLIIGIISLLSILTYQNNLQQLRTSELVNHSNEVLICTERLMGNMLNIETGQRGYIISGKPEFLQHYYGGRDSVNYNMNNLRRIMSSNPQATEMLDRLSILIEQRLKLDEKNVNTRNRDFETVISEISSMKGKKIMDEIRLLIDSVQATESKLLLLRAKSNQEKISIFNNTYFLSASIFGLIVCGLFYSIYTNMQARNKAEQELYSYQSQLEMLVEARTSQLTNANKDLKRHSELLNQMGALTKVGGWEIVLQDMSVVWTEEVGKIHELPQGVMPSVEDAIKYYAPEARPIIEEAVQQAIEQGKGWDLELPFITAKGNHLWVRTVGYAQFEAGQATRVFGTFQDITDQKRIKDEIIHLNENLELKIAERTQQLELANKELESFSYSISHDLRAPLRSINGYAMALRDEYAHKLDGEGLRLLGVVMNNAKRMGQLIDDLLAFSRLGRQALSKSSINMDELVKQIADELVSQRDNRLIEMTILPLGNAKGDINMLRQVWINLISNALKYSEKKDKSIVEIGYKKDKGSSKTYYVKDNGAGFDMNYSNKLFGVFQRLHKTREFEGTGVGLAIVKRIVEKHGGHVSAYAEEGVGATFYFSLSNK